MTKDEGGSKSVEHPPHTHTDTRGLIRVYTQKPNFQGDAPSQIHARDASTEANVSEQLPRFPSLPCLSQGALGPDVKYL